MLRIVDERECTLKIRSTYNISGMYSARHKHNATFRFVVHSPEELALLIEGRRTQFW